jgi:hypothetical protein
MPSIRVLKPGRWAVPGKPWLPQVEARAGAELIVGEDIDLEMAVAACECGKAEEVCEPHPDEDPEAIEVRPDSEVETKPEAAKVETKPKSRRGSKASK